MSCVSSFPRWIGLLSLITWGITWSPWEPVSSAAPPVAGAPTVQDTGMTAAAKAPLSPPFEYRLESAIPADQLAQGGPPPGRGRGRGQGAGGGPGAGRGLGRGAVPPDTGLMISSQSIAMCSISCWTTTPRLHAR